MNAIEAPTLRLDALPAGHLALAARIHDRVVQALYGVTLGADEPLSPELQRRCRDELINALIELRAALHEPSPEAAQAGRSLLDEARRLRAEGVPLERSIWPKRAVPTSLEPLLCSVLVEAVRNAYKHSDPDSIRVEVRIRSGRLTMDVVNDGAWRRSALDLGAGSGLRLVADAAVEHCGRLRWGPAGEQRWMVSLRVPTRRG
jgi:nitrate/nitrite-specific signal transduction histidine kinase